MKEFENCTLYGMIGNATEEQREGIVSYLCEPSCALECPVKSADLEFTGDGVVPYIEGEKGKNRINHAKNLFGCEGVDGLTGFFHGRFYRKGIPPKRKRGE